MERLVGGVRGVRRCDEPERGSGDGQSEERGRTSADDEPRARRHAVVRDVGILAHPDGQGPGAR
eukprot:1533724-Pyramimonas_sp.AAC.1